MADKELTGLFFGSFNPVHNGHIAIARYMLETGYCRQVWFVVSPQNPWKTDRYLLDGQKRLEIVQKAIAGEPGMKACDIEFSLPRPSYTYQTLDVLSQKYPEEKLALIIGGDNLRSFHLWRNYREIMAAYPLLVYPRPGEELPLIPGADLTLIQAPLIGLSSTGIREKLRADGDIADDVPAAALDVILQYYCPR